jgi:hypothetical protein
MRSSLLCDTRNVTDKGSSGLMEVAVADLRFECESAVYNETNGPVNKARTESPAVAPSLFSVER